MPFLIFSARIFGSIEAETPSMLTCDNALYPSSGLTIIGSFVGATFFKGSTSACLIPSSNAPSTPKIDTPNLIFSAVIFESIADVTALT